MLIFPKSEVLVAVEASKVAEKNVLEEQMISVQEALQQKIAEHSALQQEHTLVSLFTFIALLEPAKGAVIIYGGAGWWWGDNDGKRVGKVIIYGGVAPKRKGLGKQNLE